MIPEELKIELVNKLLRLPIASGDNGAEGRDVLLSGIPHEYLGRTRGNNDLDMSRIVGFLATSFDGNGDWHLLKFVDNAVAKAPYGSDLAKELLQLRMRLMLVRHKVWPSQLHAVEVAQVHLFDLRHPILTCLGLLLEPSAPAVSGFVVPTPIPRLVHCFCDSLKQRGQQMELWAREEVADPGATVKVDTVFNPVASVVRRLDGIQSLLARQHVLWPLYVDDPDDAKDLWDRLSSALKTPPANRLVITFGMPPGTLAPEGMKALPAPKFTSQDITNWVGPIGERLPLDSQEIELWAKTITAGCAGPSDELPIEMVYEQLDVHCGLVVKHRDNPGNLMIAVKEQAAWNLPEGDRA